MKTFIHNSKFESMIMLQVNENKKANSNTVSPNCRVLGSLGDIQQLRGQSFAIF